MNVFCPWKIYFMGGKELSKVQIQSITLSFFFHLTLINILLTAGLTVAFLVRIASHQFQGFLLAKKWTDNVFKVLRANEKIILLKLIIG